MCAKPHFVPWMDKSVYICYCDLTCLKRWFYFYLSIIFKKQIWSTEPFKDYSLKKNLRGSGPEDEDPYDIQDERF